MKNRIYTLVSLLFLSCCFSGTGKRTAEITVFERDTVINKAILHHVDLIGIYTFASIPCKCFEGAFSRDMQRDTITDVHEIALLKSYMDNMRPTDSTHRKSVDTRAKLFFLSPSDTIEFCLDGAILYSKGRYYLTPEELVIYIENLQNRNWIPK